jgi:hypothetical protein
VLATVLAVDCRAEDTCCVCCFVLHGKMCFVEVVVADAAAAKVPTLWAHVCVDLEALLLVVALLELLFLVRSTVA